MKIISHANKGINSSQGSQNRHTRRTINRPATQKLRKEMARKLFRSINREGRDQPLPPKMHRAQRGRWGGRVSASKRMATTTVTHRAAPRQPRHRATGSNAGAGSGSGSGDDGDGGGGSDGEPPHQSPLLLDYEDLSRLLKVAVGTLKNRYSRDPSSLPPAILIPGCRGPRWLLATVLRWLEAHETPAPAAPVTPKRKAGRPRIAAGKGGVS